jgi:membrane associated rhomboid family serine protease
MSLSTTAIVLILMNVVISFLAFRDAGLFSKMLFQVNQVKAGQFYRLISAGFLHVDWNHLFFNMFTFYFFAGSVSQFVGTSGMLLIYAVSLLGGNLLAFLFNRNNPTYRAVGASGAVSGIVYASIALNPGMDLYIMFIPIPIPAWVFGVGFIIYSLYGMGKANDNIGHEAHLGGAVTGLLGTLALVPSVATTNPLTILYILVPAVVVLVVQLVKPKLLNLSHSQSSSAQTVDDTYRDKRAEKQLELDRILDKINQEGRDSLTAEERQFLEQNG